MDSHKRKPPLDEYYLKGALKGIRPENSPQSQTLWPQRYHSKRTATPSGSLSNPSR